MNYKTYEAYLKSKQKSLKIEKPLFRNIKNFDSADNVADVITFSTNVENDNEDFYTNVPAFLNFAAPEKLTAKQRIWECKITNGIDIIPAHLVFNEKAMKADFSIDKLTFSVDPYPFTIGKLGKEDISKISKLDLRISRSGITSILIGYIYIMNDFTFDSEIRILLHELEPLKVFLSYDNALVITA